MRYALVRVRTQERVDRPRRSGRDRLDLETFARACALHPELVRRLVALGLLEPERDAAGELWFRPAEVTTAARIQRLRAGLNVNYAAAGVVMDLLDRVAELERELRRRRASGG